MPKIPFCLFTIPERRKKLVWEITSRCNMQCKHCCSDASNLPNNLFEDPIFSDRNLCRKKINELTSSGIKEFYISGGEPFLVKNICEFLEFLKGKGVNIDIASNGYYMTENTSKRLAQIKINLLHISLDGHLPIIHNFLRGGNFFDTTVKNIKRIKKYRIPLRIGCIIWRKNENFLEEMVKLCVHLKVEKLRFSWLVRVGRFKDNPQLYPKRGYQIIMSEIKNLQKKYQKEIDISIHRMSRPKNSWNQLCPGGDKLFFLNSSGQLSPCSWIAKIDSQFTTKKKLKEMEFRNLVKQKTILNFKKMLQKRQHKGFKGCPFIAKYQNNSYYSNDKLIK